MMSEYFLAITLFWSIASTVRQDQDYAKLLREAKITLAQAVDLAIKDSKPERTALSAWIWEFRGKQEFSVGGAREDKSFGVGLDLAEGKILLTSLVPVNESAVAKAFKIKLTDAIQTALKQEKGQAVWAKFELTAAQKPEGTVRIFNNGKIRIVKLDGETGKIISVKDGP